MKNIVLLIGLSAFFAPAVQAQEMVVGGFPLGVGSSVGPEFWAPYESQMAELARTLAENPDARAVLVGWADGSRFASGNDAKNPGLSLGRAHALRNVLVGRFGVDSTQLLIQSNDVSVRGDQYRSVTVRIEMPAEPAEPVVIPAVVAQESPVVAEPPAAQPPVMVTETTNNFYDAMTLRLGGGVSSSPFGALPLVSGAIIWNQAVSLEVVVGHTFWSDSYAFKGATLSTWQRMVGGRLTVYPWHNKTVGIIGGWTRIEKIAQSYYEYVRLSEGPVLGLSVIPFKHLSVTGLYNPARHRVEDTELSSAKNGQFLFSVNVFTDFGGSK